MAVQQQQLDPLPIPEEKVDVQTAQSQQQELPPSAGFVSKSGAGAYIASQALNGWMAGRHFAQQKKLEEAKLKVSTAHGLYQSTEEEYKRLVDNGADPNSPEMQKAKANAVSAWQNYMGAAAPYVEQPKTGKTKGQKVKGGLHDIFMGHDPQVIAQGSYEMLKNQGPPVLSYTPSEAKKREDTLQKQQLELNEQNLQANHDAHARQADVDALTKQREEAIKNHDKLAQHDAEEALAGHGITIQHVQSVAAAEAADLQEQEHLKALETLKEPGKNSGDLSVLGRATLNIQLGPWDVYMNQVGPGKRFKDGITANRAYLHDAAVSQAIAGRSAQAEQWAAMRRAEATVLAHDLQDPKLAREAGLPGPLKAGEKVPDWLIEKSVMGRLKPTPEERNAAKLNVDKSISGAINNTMHGLPAADQKFATDNLLDYDEETKTYSIKPWTPEVKEHWKIFGGDKQGGVSPEEFQRKREVFLAHLTGYINKTNPEASADRIKAAVHSPDPAQYLLDNQDAGKRPEAIEPPPKETTQLGDEGTEVEYMVSDDKGNSKVVSMTPDHAEALRQGNSSWKIERYTGKPAMMQPMPHGH